MTGFELDVVEMGYPGAVCAAAENAPGRSPLAGVWWRSGWVAQQARYAVGLAGPRPAWRGDGVRR